MPWALATCAPRSRLLQPFTTHSVSALQPLGEMQSIVRARIVWVQFLSGLNYFTWSASSATLEAA